MVYSFATGVITVRRSSGTVWFGEAYEGYEAAVLSPGLGVACLRLDGNTLADEPMLVVAAAMAAAGTQAFPCMKPLGH